MNVRHTFRALGIGALLIGIQVTGPATGRGDQTPPPASSSSSDPGKNTSQSPAVKTQSTPATPSQDSKPATPKSQSTNGNGDETKPKDDRKPEEKKSEEKKSEERKSEEKKPEDKKPEEKKTEDKRVDDKRSEDRKSDEKKVEEKKVEEKKTEEKKSEDKKSDEKKAEDKKAEDRKAEDKKSEEKKAEESTEKEKGKEKESSGKRTVSSMILTVKLALIADPRIFPYEIEVEGGAEEIALSGKVGNEGEKSIAGSVARTVPGVKNVVNKIDIVKDLPDVLGRKQDDILTHQVKERFARSATLKAANFEVKTEGGVVSLAGTVRFQVFIWEAAEAAREVPGVRAVRTDKVKIESEG
ncbi:BON domain-containing protein [Nitrospira sp. KM1]|uniref:BON domain-containing protein n=1 Tax=Nitrospira sp. KM1 TaxID=1936990 RepID=UPI00156737FB|nr:BON domain-containing protein [Nitrospira sp. KM1]